MILLDLFSGPGVGALGFVDAGFEVWGVDRLDYGKTYPGFFILGDAEDVLDEGVGDVAAIWADPPVGYNVETLAAELAYTGKPWAMGGNQSTFPTGRLFCGTFYGRTWHRHRYVAGLDSVPWSCSAPPQERPPDAVIAGGVWHPPAAQSLAELGAPPDWVLDLRQIAEAFPRLFARTVADQLVARVES